jgi:hypothetical protein
MFPRGTAQGAIALNTNIFILPWECGCIDTQSEMLVLYQKMEVLVEAAKLQGLDINDLNAVNIFKLTNQEYRDFSYRYFLLKNDCYPYCELEFLNQDDLPLFIHQ